MATAPGESSDDEPRRKPGRPPKGRGPAAPRHAILNETGGQIARNGYDATTFRSVAAALGVSVATIQHQFPTKGDLFRALVDEVRVPQVLANNPELTRTEPSPTPHIDISVMVNRAIGGMFNRANLFYGLLADTSPGHEERAAYLNQRLQPIYNHGRNMAATAIADGQLRDINLDALFAIISMGLGAIASAPQTALDHAEIDLTTPEAKQHLIDGLIDIISHGILQDGPD